MDWAKAIASFRSVMHAINIGGGAGASVETHMSQPTTLSIRRPDDWHVHLRDGRDAGGLRRAHGAPVRPRHHHAQPGAAGDQGRRGRGLSRANSQSGSGRARVRAADDLLPDRRRRSGRARARQERGRVGRRQALSRACHDQLGARRDLDGRDRPRPRGDGEGRHAAAGPWRGHRSRGRHLRPRGGVPRQGAGAADRSAIRA